MQDRFQQGFSEAHFDRCYCEDQRSGGETIRKQASFPQRFQRRLGYVGMASVI